MTSRDFAYWLQGFFELSESKVLTKKQTETIKKHLDLVFYHEIDPSYTSDPEKQKEMNKIHSSDKEKIILEEEKTTYVSKPLEDMLNNYIPQPTHPFDDGLIRC